MMQTTRTHALRTAIVAALVGVLAAIIGPATAVGAQESTGWARFGHFAPSADEVDVFVDGELAFAGIGFKSVSDYGMVAAGTRRFEVRPAGQADAEAIVSVDVNVPPEGAVTVGAVTTLDEVTPQVYDDELIVPAADEALVRFIHATPEAAAVDVAVAGGDPIVTNVPYPEATDYQQITPGTYDVVITDSDSGDTVLEVDGWTITPGQQATIVVVRGSDGALDVAPLVDSVAIADAPEGGVQTGFGGMSDVLAPGSSGVGPFESPTSIVAALVAVLAFAGFVVARKRVSSTP